MRSRGVGTVSGILVVAAFTAGCGGGHGSTGGRLAGGPPPSEMCSNGEAPAVAAYELETGKFKWATCTADRRYRDVLAVTDRTVYVGVGSYPEQSIVALDAANGRDTPSAPPPPAGSTDSLSCYGGPPTSYPPPPAGGAPFCGGALSSIVVGDTRLVGGQDDPTTAFDASSGAKRWEHAGSTPYDGVWAVGDGAVYVIDKRSEPGVARLVAYELNSGAVRWEQRKPMDAQMGEPWNVSGRRLFTIGSNLAVLSTKDGNTLWRTNHPVVPLPRLTGVRANGSTVFVAFSMVPSGD